MDWLSPEQLQALLLIVVVVVVWGSIIYLDWRDENKR